VSITARHRSNPRKRLTRNATLESVLIVEAYALSRADSAFEVCLELVPFLVGKSAAPRPMLRLLRGCFQSAVLARVRPERRGVGGSGGSPLMRRNRASACSRPAAHQRLRHVAVSPALHAAGDLACHTQGGLDGVGRRQSPPQGVGKTQTNDRQRLLQAFPQAWPRHRG
jgi:hypothetical protein